MLLFTHLNICSRASTTCFSNDCILDTPIKHPSKFSSNECRSTGPLPKSWYRGFSEIRWSTDPGTDHFSRLLLADVDSFLLDFFTDRYIIK